MSAHEKEAAVRGHGARPTTCDHDGTLLLLATANWCPRCGAIHIDGQWKNPMLNASTAVRDRDTMYETLTIVQRRCTDLLNEVRDLKVQLETNREVNRGALETAIKIGDTQRKALERVAAELNVSVEWLVTGKGPLPAKA